MNETDTENKANLEKQRGERNAVRARPVRKLYPRDYRPVCCCCATSIVTMPGDVYALFVETAGRHCKSFYMCVIPKDSTLKSTVAFSTNVEA